MGATLEVLKGEENVEGRDGDVATGPVESDSGGWVGGWYLCCDFVRWWSGRVRASVDRPVDRSIKSIDRPFFSFPFFMRVVSKSLIP